ncbi:MAG: HEAT repeat domain-containing protein [Gemmatimonadaceae bacterium]
MVTAEASAASLSRELSDFLIELSVAMHKNAIYPDGHPLLGAAAVALARRLDPLLDQRSSIAFGVAPNQLVIEGVPTDTNNPLLREVAFRLYKRGIGALKLMRGIELEELGDVLKVIARDPPSAREDKIKQLGPESQHWKNARVYALLYDQLELMDGAEGDVAYEGESGTWAAQLWLALARHAMTEGDDGGMGPVVMDEDGNPVPQLPSKSVDPLIIARAIERRQKDATYDEAIVGYLTRFAEEIRARGGAEALGLQRRISQLVGALSPETLKRLMFLSGDQDQRREFLLDASHILEVETVVELVQAAANASSRSLSNPLLILLSKLAKHAEVGQVSERSKADWALRENVRQLIGGWEDAEEVLPDDDYERVLEQLVRQTPGLASTPSVYSCEPDRTMQIALEIGVIGAAAKRAVTQLIARGRLATLLDMMEATPDTNGAIDALWKRLGTPGLIRQILRIQPVDFQGLYRIVSRVGRVGIEPLLDALQEAEDRTTRWKLFELLVQVGTEVGTIVVDRLPEAPWYVQRNLLALLGRLSEWPEAWSPLPFAQHEDVRVRREAVKLLLKMPMARDQAIIDGLVDPDDSVVRLAIGAAMEGCPERAVTLLVKKLQNRQTDSVLRVLSVRVLATVHSIVAMDTLVRVSLAKRRWLVGRRRLKPKSAELLAALQGLTNWPTESKAAAVLALAAQHPDPEVRDAATQTITNVNAVADAAGEPV